MSVGFGYCRFQCAMPSLQCFNMRFYGHIRTSPWPVEERTSEGGSPTSRAEHPDGSLPRHHTVKDVLGYRDGAGREFVRGVAHGTHRQRLQAPSCRRVATRYDKLAANDLRATGRRSPHIVGGLPTGVSLYQIAIARIVRRPTTGAIGKSAPRFRIAYSTMNSAVPK